METYTEKQPWGQTVYDVIPKTHIQFTTLKQKVDLITNPYFGRILFLDNCLQSATADEHIYHQELVSKGIVEGRSQRRVLIAGGAEGATLREIQNFDAKFGLGVEEIIMVDWDQELVDYMDKEEPWSQGSFDDPRVKLIFEDIHVFLKENKQPFDTVLFDLLDIEGEKDLVFLFDAIKSVATTSLVPNGIVTCNVGGNPLQASKLQGMLIEVFPTFTYEIHSTFIPSFQETWFFLTIEKKEAA